VDGALGAQGGKLVCRLLLLEAVAEHVDLVVEICLHAVFQLDPLPLGVGWYGEVEAPLVDDLVVVDVSFSLVEEVHLQSKERELEGVGNEGEGLRRVLLFETGGVLPAAFGQGRLDMFRLRGPSQRKALRDEQGEGVTNHICVNEFPAPEHVHP